MKEKEHDARREARPVGVNAAYAALQIAKALRTCENHEDPETRERAQGKISKWEMIFQNILDGTVHYGSRLPVESAPAWATLEVMTGGFATGNLLAGGPLQDYERRMLDEVPGCPKGEERLALNAYFLTDKGLAELHERLRSGCYEIGVPEEGALLVVAWLVENGHTKTAHELLDELSPYFGNVRFYPIPLECPRHRGATVHLQDVGQTITDLRKIGPNRRILAQQEAVRIWAPLYDRCVTLFLETVEDGWPCRKYPAGWGEKAMALLREYAELRKRHQICGKPDDADENFAQLRCLMERCAGKPESLGGREVGRIRMILNHYIAKRGVPGSARCNAARGRQLNDLDAPTYHQIAQQAVIPRFEKHSRAEGIDDVSVLRQPVTKEESSATGIPEGTLIPESIQRKVERCLNETVAVLVERGLITSSDTLARVLPQITSGIGAAGIAEPMLRELYAAVYRAFRRRRSLLLLNLEKQIQIKELPWVQAINRFRKEDLSGAESARQTMEELSFLAVTSFPHAILPNKLIQELRALAKAAGLSIPLVDELAADIFMGEFSPKFAESAKLTAELLEHSLYAVYYGIDCAKIRKMKARGEQTQKWFPWNSTGKEPDDFAGICSERAGVDLGQWSAAANGMIIEQEQILTTHNLAALFAGLELERSLQGQFGDLAKRCFKWVCRRQQMKTDEYHARLIMLKNTAYAWRQMIFFLALASDAERTEFLGWAEGHFAKQKEDFRSRFRPALNGLVIAVNGRTPESGSGDSLQGRRFLGWCKEMHWLMA